MIGFKDIICKRCFKREWRWHTAEYCWSCVEQNYRNSFLSWKNTNPERYKEINRNWIKNHQEERQKYQHEYYQRKKISMSAI